MCRGSRQRRHRRMEEEEYGAGGYEGEQYAGDGDQYTAMQVTPHNCALMHTIKLLSSRFRAILEKVALCKKRARQIPTYLSSASTSLSPPSTLIADIIITMYHRHCDDDDHPGRRLPSHNGRRVALQKRGDGSLPALPSGSASSSSPSELLLSPSP